MMSLHGNSQGRLLKTLAKLFMAFILLTVTFMTISTTKVRAAEQQMQTFYDCELPGIRVQVNATSYIQPSKTITVSVNLLTQTNVYVNFFNVELLGFINGTVKTSIANITDSYFGLDTGTRTHSTAVFVPELIWGAMYGEMKITYLANLGGIQLVLPKLMSSFPMTQVENTYLENLENQVRTLDQSNHELEQQVNNVSSSFEQLNASYYQLQKNYTSAQGNAADLDSTRRLTAVLGIVAAFFVATTVYLVIRKTREAW
jgi:hypothetical protein